MAVVDCQDTNATTHGLSNRTGENNCFINSVIQVSLVCKDVDSIFVLVVPIIVLATMKGESYWKVIDLPTLPESTLSMSLLLLLLFCTNLLPFRYSGI